MRSLLLWGLWELSGQVGPGWVWLWQSSGLVWPWLRRQPGWRGLGWLVWHGQRGLMVAYLGLSVVTLLRWGSAGTFTPSALDRGGESQGSWAVGLGCVVCRGEESRVEVAQTEDGGSDLIRRTNNTVELVIRRFDQHYQNFGIVSSIRETRLYSLLLPDNSPAASKTFRGAGQQSSASKSVKRSGCALKRCQNFCGFESIESARLFLGVFEKLYRFTPFSQDAQPRIRGKCPLELAGYDVSQVPIASLCAGLSVAWPLEVAQNLVPNP